MSLASVAGIVGPPMATALFAYFISSDSRFYLPGAAFFFSSALVFVAMLLAVRSFRRNGFNAPAPGTPADRPKP